jgi:MoxR-like ATPase
MAKARAMCVGRYHVSIGDIKQLALPVLRHRLLLNFEGEANGISIDEIMTDVINHISGQGAKVK